MRDQVARRILYVNVTATLGVDVPPNATPADINAALEVRFPTVLISSALPSYSIGVICPSSSKGLSKLSQQVNLISRRDRGHSCQYVPEHLRKLLHGTS